MKFLSLLMTYEIQLQYIVVDSHQVAYVVNKQDKKGDESSASCGSSFNNTNSVSNSQGHNRGRGCNSNWNNGNYPQCQIYGQYGLVALKYYNKFDLIYQ